ncbi:MAG: VCBS repeat-containing protein [Caldilineaceae bacterium]|nr:VCBS repeat-containing protein [Caldilineaceae bacterium]
MKNMIRRTPTLLPLLLSTVLSCVFAVGMLLGTARPALAEDPTVFLMSHEIKLSSMLAIDLDGDGKQELIGGSVDGYISVIDGATYETVWDKNIAEYLPPYTNSRGETIRYTKTRIQSSLAAADLDHDGAFELVVATGGAEPLDADGPGAVVVLTYRGAPDYFELMNGWPRYAFNALGDDAPDGFISTPSLGDIDGDGDMEIVIGGMDRRIHAFHHTGNYVTGWPLDRSYLLDGMSGILRESRSTASLADLDGDGVLDIIIGSNNYKIPNCANPYLFYAVKGDSTPLPGFPFETTQNIESSPAIGDINGDGSLDIVFGTGDFNESCRQPGGQSSDGKKVYAIDRFGKPLPGWPVATNADMPNSPALGDLDNDGSPEVVIHTVDTLYAWHGNGSLVQGFPVHGEFHLRHAAPLLADVDGDSEVEIVLASGQVYGPGGQLEQQREKLQSLLIITDQDGDGLLETIGSNWYHIDDRYLRTFIYQETGPATGALPWPMFHRSNDRTGILLAAHTLRGRVVDEENQGVPDVTVTLDGGQIAVTDAQGNYVFGSLPPDSYTVTPSHQNNRFTPAEQAVTLSANATGVNFVMIDPLNDIQGKVLHANNSPMRGINVQLDPGTIAATGATGSFIFKDQNPGNYTLTPVTSALTYLPPQRTVNSQDEQLHIFHALAQPVAATLLPNNETEISFTDTQGLRTRIIFPAGLGEDEVVVTPVLPEEPNGYLSTGHALEVALSSADANAQSSAMGQDDELLPFTIEIKYNQADLQTLPDAKGLVLLWESPEGWVEANTTCSTPEPTLHNQTERLISTTTCAWGTYLLAAPTDRLYMPTLVNPLD